MAFWHTHSENDVIRTVHSRILGNVNSALSLGNSFKGQGRAPSCVTRIRLYEYMYSYESRASSHDRINLLTAA
eukprot:COSAG01_NODE_2432_length_7707_cov_17.497240_10_plen_73_part_00